MGTPSSATATIPYSAPAILSPLPVRLRSMAPGPTAAGGELCEAPQAARSAQARPTHPERWTQRCGVSLAGGRSARGALAARSLAAQHATIRLVMQPQRGGLCHGWEGGGEGGGGEGGGMGARRRGPAGTAPAACLSSRHPPGRWTHTASLCTTCARALPCGDPPAAAEAPAPHPPGRAPLIPGAQ